MDQSGGVAALVELVREAMVLQMVDVAAITMFVWDYLITFGMEVEYVWCGKWNFITAVYLVQRYLPFIDTVWMMLHVEHFGANLSPEMCTVLTNTSRYIMFVGLALSEVILTFRAWAVWERKRVLTIALPILFIACWIPPILVLHDFLKALHFSYHPIPHWKGCFAIMGSYNIVVVWILLLVWDLFILILMVVPALKAYHYRGYSALYSTVYAEGIVYYLYLFVMSALNIVLLRLDSVSTVYRFMFVSMSRCLHSTLTSRALLHIRARLSEGTTVGIVTITTDESAHLDTLSSAERHAREVP
ncbi:unnamed protein product [Cyclocybe aegerita]|uniref:DUF6533 domain-containing protein n=1 Tax=Cyclocybe aegerita TaxID=1973307 RepID=A0A8S0XJ90_CYCAE|nr:unnamed protein product [Cyclocybe aegerita]